ncbi:hypothetical protein [Chondrinema litorale]|uniref:hypothetical protein n=1 Tax=Chondrinema litorale TaxID=2994555 RepID=UPI002542BAC7|nr:hypothetical protein [Chondrinema litorale]UZR93983.1 hypothetical protein OQ292_19240 [Chondrinema litorale]
MTILFLLSGFGIVLITLTILCISDKVKTRSTHTYILKLNYTRSILALYSVVFCFLFILSLFVHFIEEKTVVAFFSFVTISILFLIPAAIAIIYFYQYYQIEKNRTVTIDRVKKLIEITRENQTHIFSYNDITNVELYKSGLNKSPLAYFTIAVLNTKNNEKIALTSITVGESKLERIMNELFIVENHIKYFRFLSKDEVEILKKY